MQEKSKKENKDKIEKKKKEKKENKDKKELVGDLLRSAREKRSKSQSEISESIGLSKNQISLIEKGECMGSIETLLGYCDCLDMEPNDILARGNDSIPFELRDLIEKLSKTEQEKLIEILKIIKS